MYDFVSPVDLIYLCLPLFHTLQPHLVFSFFLLIILHTHRFSHINFFFFGVHQRLFNSRPLIRETVQCIKSLRF